MILHKLLKKSLFSQRHKQLLSGKISIPSIFSSFWDALERDAIKNDANVLLTFKC